MTTLREMYEDWKKIEEEKKFNNAFKRAFYQMEIDNIDIEDAESDRLITHYDKLIEEEWYYEQTTQIKS